MKFTLDNNCLIALEQGTEDGEHIAALLKRHRWRRISLAVSAIHASENQKNAPPMENFADFQAYVARIGMRGVRVLKPLAYYDLTFWDWSVWSSPGAEALDRDIHRAMFPREATELKPDASAGEQRTWRRHKCDVLSLWSHIYANRDVYVTSDRHFHKPRVAPLLLNLGAGQILRPRDAVAATMR